MSATHTAMRPELEALPERMAHLPVDKRGFPVPWFVAWVNGEPEFRAMDPQKWARAVRERLCWVCGGQCGRWLTFVIGPMCGVNRTSSEPGCHRECARWSARNCPFISRPQMVRREDEVFSANHENIAGVMIPRNPGVTALWTSDKFSIFRDDKNRPLIHLGDPDSVEWWALGRPANRAEVEESIRTGLPLLEEVAQQQEGAMDELRKMHAAFLPLLPEK